MTPPKTPLLTVDCVVIDANARVLLITRKYPPFEGQHALPGGFVEVGETVEEACKRELFEETGLRVDNLQLVGVYSDPARDPRGHSCSVVFLVRVNAAEATAGDDAASISWVKEWRGVNLAFDHRQILEDAFAQLDRDWH